MNHGRNFFLIGLCILAANFFTYADDADPKTGHIGILLSHAKELGLFTVEDVAVGSPAATAGLKAGDFVTSINGIPTKGMTLKDARDLIRGDVGGVIKITVRHVGFTEEEISIMRQSLLDTYSPAATAGDPRAEFYLGHFYEHGPVQVRDLTKAASWYFKAARQNFAPAEAYLGYMCRNGLGVKKDPNAAAVWLQAGAKQGDPFAERELAFEYLEGEGVQRSDQDAFAWFYSAAIQDDSTAERNLALLYQNGHGVARDYQAALLGTIDLLNLTTLTESAASRTCMSMVRASRGILERH